MSVTRSVLVLAALAVPAAAHAFAEDVCYLDDGSGVTACIPLPASCGTPSAPDTSPSYTCLTDVVVAAGATGPLEGRSTLHTDATHVMAQAIGFDEDDAYWIAAYDEATDLEIFQARKLDGSLDTTYPATKSIDGFSRNSPLTGGLLYHFHGPYNGGSSTPPSVDGLDPDVHDEDEEAFLAHVRRWAFGASGSAEPLCVGGITEESAGGDYALGTDCMDQPDGDDATLHVAIAAVFGLHIPFPVTIQPQEVTNTTSSPIDVSGFDSWIGAEADNARLGIYVHAVADRISHHRCIDDSVLAGPDSDNDFDLDMSSPECSQGNHVLRHAWEAGVDQSALAAVDRTTEAALRAVWDELVAAAYDRGVLKARALRPAYRDALLEDLVEAIEEVDAEDRLEALRDVACDRGLEAFPGSASACP